MFTYFTDHYQLPNERMEQVRHSILENAEQALMEAVAGVLSLKNDPQWGGGLSARADQRGAECRGDAAVWIGEDH